MVCCGNKRSRLSIPRRQSVAPKTARVGPQPARPGALARTSPPPVASGTTLFEYVGLTAMTVIGRVTGRRYRFERPGTTVAVDTRDVPGFSMVPHVRRA
jgi:hypothetical protein